MYATLQLRLAEKRRPKKLLKMLDHKQSAPIEQHTYNLTNVVSRALKKTTTQNMHASYSLSKTNRKKATKNPTAK